MPASPPNSRFRDRAELAAALADIQAAPKDGGRIEAIVVRPRPARGFRSRRWG